MKKCNLLGEDNDLNSFILIDYNNILISENRFE